MKNSFRRLTALCISAAMGLAMAQSLPLTASAASDYWKFDFGAGGVQSGYTGVSASDGYNSGRGWGFASGTNVSNVGASGSGALSDAVRFNNSSPTGGAVFCADVPNGLYQVSVWLGDTNRTSVAIEGMYQIMNMTGNGAYHTLQVPVTDGQLNICACAGKEGNAYTMAALEIKKISDQTHTNPTIWVCGDSTVCNYYPLANSNEGAQAGWAQLLPDVVGSDWQVMNMATGGQFAKGFIDAGQFKVIEKNGQSGDIFIVSIGINDTNYSNASEYHDAVTSMAKTALSKGMRVMLVKQQGRDGDILRNPKLEKRWFADELNKVGAELGVEVVDLFNLWQNFRISINDSNPSPYYLKDDDLHICRRGAKKIAEIITDAINSGAQTSAEPADLGDGKVVMFTNKESGMYLSVEDGAAADGTNVSQSSSAVPTAANTWKLVKADSDGGYYIYSMLGGGSTYLLDVEDGKTANGTNVGIWSKTGASAQLFRIYQNGNYYHIATAPTDYKSYVGIWGGSHEEKGNAIEWENDRTDNQKWTISAPPSDEDFPLLQGDLDGDGHITAKDLTLLKRRIMQSSAEADRVYLAGDLNGDLKLDAADAELLRQYLTTETDAFADRKYPATEQTFENGWREETNAGYLWRDYLDLDNSTASSVTFTVNVPQTGNYLCTFHIANGSQNDRSMKVTVAGKSEYWKQSFLTTGAWTTWQERGIVLPLTAGINTITLRSETSEGGPNFDFMEMSFTDEPIAQPYDGSSQPSQTGSSDKPTVFIASDSTAQSYREDKKPQQGWGYYLKDYFTDAVNVENHSIAGRSSKSFYDNGRLQTILDNIKTGDYLIVDFGINDGDSSKSERYAPICGNVDSPSNGSFEYYMTIYIKGALDKGATPILMSPTLSIRGQKQPYQVGYRNVDTVLRSFASKYKIPYFDLGSAMTNAFNSINSDTVYNYYMGSTTPGGTDFTHFTEDGANAVAKIAADGIKGLNIDLSKYVK